MVKQLYFHKGWFKAHVNKDSGGLNGAMLLLLLSRFSRVQLCATP